MTNTQAGQRRAKYVWIALIYLIAAAAGAWWLFDVSARSGGLGAIPFDAMFAPSLVIVLGFLGAGGFLFYLCRPGKKRERDRSLSGRTQLPFCVKHQLMPGAMWLSKHLSQRTAMRLRVFQSPWLFIAPMIPAWLLQFVNSLIIGVSLPGPPPAIASPLSLAVSVLMWISFFLVYTACLFGYASHRALQRAGESLADAKPFHSRPVIGGQSVDE